MSPFNRSLLFLRTVRYLTAGQILSRCDRTLRRSWRAAARRRSPKSPAPDLGVRAPVYAGLADVHTSGPWNSQACACVRRAEALRRREFCFLNHRVEFPAEIGWQDPHHSRLWRFNLHYFDYIQDLLVWSARGNADAAYETFRSIACSWMDHNDLIRGDGWHPYTISLRAVNWLHALSGFAEQLRDDAGFRARLQQSLRGQTRFLTHELEKDLRGNHLLANLYALIIVGLAGRDTEAWVRKSLVLLQHELAEQVLPDGGHFERSPGYHALVLRHCLEIALALRCSGKPVPQWLDEALRRMLCYLKAILPADGQVPLLKDTTRDAHPPFDLLAAGALYLNQPRLKKSDDFGLYPLLLFGTEGYDRFRAWPINGDPEPSRELANSGHCVMRDDPRGDHLIFDAGRPCPDYLPGHAHADLLSYELRACGHRIVVDSGVYEYAAGPWRDYFRSTGAHNTVQVGGASQSEVWSSFRVARRARPGKTVWFENDGCTLVQCSHDGYTRLRPPATHRRTLVWKHNHFWLVVDELLGVGPAIAGNHVHLHPNLTLASATDGNWQLQGAGCPLWIVTFGGDGHEIVRGQMEPVRQGWYSEHFGEMVPNTVLTLHRRAALPFCFGYVLFKQVPGTVQLIPGLEANRVVIAQEGQQSSLRVPRDGSPVFE